MKQNLLTTSILNKLLSLVLLGLMVFNSAWALDTFKIDDIRVEGLQRVEPGTVFATVPFKVGDNYTEEKGTQAIRSLFALGLFKDVRIDIKSNVIIIAIE